MLSVVLKILSILGILILCLLGLAVLAVILVFFYPVGYKVTGRKKAGQMFVSARATWLFGFLRVRYDYPEPGRVIVKVLPFTVYDSGEQSDEKTEKDPSGSEKKTKKDPGGSEKKTEKDPGGSEKKAEKEDRERNREENKEEKDSKTDTGQKQTSDVSQDISLSTDREETTDSPFFKKIRKIKYTIHSIYDKIKNIWENISYYIELLQDEETKQLFSHVIFRLGKIWENIHPRRIRGQVLFGTGAPDTTGYAYGVYGMLSPFLGSRLLVTPDFTRAVLEGDIYISGHITVFTISWNILKVLLDKNYKRFKEKMKAGRKK